MKRFLSSAVSTLVFARKRKRGGLYQNGYRLSKVGTGKMLVKINVFPSLLTETFICFSCRLWLFFLFFWLRLHFLSTSWFQKTRSVK